MAQQDMIYRKLDPNGDYTFGQGSGNFHVNSAAGVAQAVKTRLGLIAGEWFLDITAGTPYNSQILGAGMLTKYNPAIQAVILETKGVLRITEYSSFFDSGTRKASIVATIDTIYGSITITHIL